MQKKMISTGKAANICSVSPDTVLKWIKKNQLNAVKTVGGHYRVNRDDLQPYIIGTYNENFKEHSSKQHSITYCWEYHSDNGKVTESCRKCMIFKTKAEKCFLLATKGKNAGHAQSFCTTSCYECEYFQYVNKSIMNILIITENKAIESKINRSVDEKLLVKFSCCGYETATIIQNFHPDYIILDESLVNSNSDELCKHLIKDPRVHGAQIILAVAPNTRKREKFSKGICATIQVPFDVKEINECLNKLQLNFFGRKSEAHM